MAFNILWLNNQKIQIIDKKYKGEPKYVSFMVENKEELKFEILEDSNILKKYYSGNFNFKETNNNLTHFVLKLRNRIGCEIDNNSSNIFLTNFGIHSKNIKQTKKQFLNSLNNF